MRKIIHVADYDYTATGTTFTEESQTRQSDYEDINSMVARIIRGEIFPRMPDEFEYTDEDVADDILAQEHPLDAEDVDLADTGSIYQDDMRDEIVSIMSGKHNVIQQERETSGATQQSSNETNVPVENMAKQVDDEIQYRSEPMEEERRIKIR